MTRGEMWTNNHPFILEVNGAKPVRYVYVVSLIFQVYLICKKPIKMLSDGLYGISDTLVLVLCKLCKTVK